MLKKILLGFVALILVLAVVVAMQPADYGVERSQDIDAPAEIVWAEFADFDNWKKWSHWEKSDPTQKTTTTGAAGSVGHKTVWAGEKTGKGSMTIAAASKPSQLKIDLAFTEPMASNAKTEFNVAPREGGVRVTWSMTGTNDFVGKFFSLVMDIEEMVGSAYEDSLTNLKAVAEESAKVAQARADAETAAAAAAAAALPAE